MKHNFQSPIGLNHNAGREVGVEATSRQEVLGLCTSFVGMVH